LAALPAAFRPWIEDCADRMQVPPDFLIAASIVAAGSVLGNRIAIAPKRLDHWIEVPTFWGLIVGRPGTMKSPALTAGLVPLTGLEQKAAVVHERAIKEHEARSLVADEKRKRGKIKIGDLVAKNPEAAHKLALEDRFNDLLQGGLHHAVTHHRYA
jgi:putative DNA primase/helicase